MKKIKVGVSLDVSDVDEQLKKIKSKNKIDIDVSADTSQITKTLSEVTGQLKKSIKIDVDTKETLREIEKVAVAADKVRTIITDYHWKTDSGSGSRVYEKSIVSIKDEIKSLAQMEREIQNFTKTLDNMRAKAKSDELVQFLNNVQDAVNGLNPEDVAKTSVELEKLQTLTTQRAAEINKAVQANKEYAKSQEDFQNQVTRTGEAIENYSSQLDLMIQKANVSGKFGLANELEKIQNELKEINPNNIEEAAEALANCKQQAKSATIEFNGVESQIKKLESASKKLKDTLGKADDLKILDTADVEKAKASLREVEAALEQLRSTGKSIDISGALDSASASAEKLEGSIDEVKSSSKTLSGSLSEIAATFGLYIGMDDVVRAVMNSFKEGIQGVIEVDAAMKDLNKVCEMTKEQFSEFPDIASTIAMEIGAGQIEIIKATEYYAKLGNAIEEASEKARLAAVFRTIGDFKDIDQASEALITIQKGFKDIGDGAEDMLRIMDVANEVGNNFTSTTEDIAEGLKRAGNVLSEANNTYEQSVGLFVAANASAQDPAKVGNGLKTIAMRLRGMETELDACGVPASKLREEILAITGGAGQAVDIMKNDGLTFKSTYDILNELAEVYPRLNDSQKAYMQEIIAGKQQANIFSGIMANMTEGASAYATALNASGSAMREHAVYMDGIEAKTNRLNENISMFWSRVVNSDMIKTVVDGLNSLMTAVHGAADIFGATTVTILGFATAFSPAIIAVGNLIAKLGGLSGILAVVTNPFTLILGAITAVVIGLGALKNAFTTTEQEVQAMTTALADYNNKVENLETSKNLYSEWDRLTQKLEDGNITLEEKKVIQEEINSITQQLSGINQEVNSILENGNLTLEEKKRLTKEILELQEKQAAEELDDSLGWQSTYYLKSKQLEDYARKIKIMQREIDEGLKDNPSAKNREQYIEEYERIKEQFKLTYAEVDLYNKDVEAMGDYAAEFGRKVVVISDGVVTLADDLYSVEEASEGADEAVEDLSISISAIPKFKPIENEKDLETLQETMDTIAEIDPFTNFDDLDVAYLSGEFLGLAGSVGESANELQRFLDTYNLLTGNLDVMEKIKKEFEENGYITPEMERTILGSGNEDLIALLDDPSTFYQKMINEIMPKYNEQVEEEKRNIIEAAKLHQKNKQALSEVVDKERERISNIKEMGEILSGTKIGENGLDDPSEKVKLLSEVVNSANGAKMAIAELNGEKVLLHYDDKGFFKEVSATKEVADGLYASMINLNGTNTVITIDENGQTAMYALGEIKEIADGTKMSLTELNDGTYAINFDGEGNVISLQKVKETTEGLVGILEETDGKTYKVTIDSETFERTVTEVQKNIDGTYSLIDESGDHPIEIVMNGDGEVIGKIDGVNTSIGELEERKKYLTENPLKVTFEGEELVINGLQNVISNADGTYTAIGTLNGQPVRITFDNHGQIVGQIEEVKSQADDASRARDGLNSAPFNPTVSGADLAIDKLNRVATAASNARSQAGTITFITENITKNITETYHSQGNGRGSSGHTAYIQSIKTGSEDIFAPVEATQDVVIMANPVMDTSEVEAFDVGGAISESGGGDGFSAPIADVQPYAIEFKYDESS